MAPTLNAIGLVVADMARSLTFYRKLGLAIPAEMDQAPHAEVEVAGMRLMWDTEQTITSFDQGWTRGSGGPQVSFAFECADPAEVDRVHAEMVAAGYDSHLKPWDTPWGQRYAILHDPDGNGVDLYASLS